MPRHPRHFPRGPCPWWCLGSPSCLGVSSITYPLCYRCYQGLLTDYTGVCMGCYCSLLTDLSSLCIDCYWVLVWSLTRAYWPTFQVFVWSVTEHAEGIVVRFSTNWVRFSLARFCTDWVRFSSHTTEACPKHHSKCVQTNAYHYSTLHTTGEQTQDTSSLPWRLQTISIISLFYLSKFFLQYSFFLSSFFFLLLPYLCKEVPPLERGPSRSLGVPSHPPQPVEDGIRHSIEKHTMPQESKTPRRQLVTSITTSNSTQ